MRLKTLIKEIEDIVISCKNCNNGCRESGKHMFKTGMVAITISVFANILSFAQQQATYTEDMVNSELQIMNFLLNKHVDYNKIYDARQFGLKAPDSLRLKTSDGYNIFAYEITPERPRGVVICLSGIENPSVTAYYGHAAKFYKHDIATIMPDLRGHGKSDGNRICIAYEEAADVKAITDYIKGQDKYKDVPVIIMGVSMGGSVAIRSIGNNKDIDAIISLSAFSSFEDFISANREAFLPNIPATEIDNVTAEAVRRMFGKDSRTSSPIYALRGLDNRPMLLMHSRNDSQVPFCCYEKILSEAAKYTKSIDTLVVDGDEHFICKDFTMPVNDKEYLDKILSFIKRITADKTL
ncbi:MAG: alpha/beta hydrolase [Prevotella sp.]